MTTELEQIVEMAAEKAASKAVRKYAEAHPRPVHVTAKDAAEMLRLSESTISRMIRAGNIRLNDSGRIPIAEIDRVIAVRST